jgi:predicted nucleic acid-binding protein
MENGVVVDSSVFIKHWRSKNKKETLLEQLRLQYRRLCVSAIAKYEVLIGVDKKSMNEWYHLFDGITVLAFDDVAIEIARNIFLQLKHENKMIDIIDILIASTAIVNDLPLATYNRNHFERIQGLHLV